MAASNKLGGFVCEFIDSVSGDFQCRVCKHVARDPSLTSCCGETFCQACIAQILEDKKPCPDCETVEFTTMPSTKIQKRILALQVCCAMKDRGCEWTGKLEGLDAHLDVDTGDCQYVNVPCPNCDEQIQKHELATHLADACPKRDYNCKYCGFTSTYEVVCNDHWPECEQYPIQCPNYCGLVAIGRCTLEDHLKLCPTQEVECEFAYAGCTDKFLRQDLEKHMEENTQKHLVLMSATTLKISQEYEKKFQEESKTLQEKLLKQQEKQLQELHQQLWEKDKEFHRQLQEKDQQTRDEIKGIHEQLRQKDRQIQEAEAKIAGLQQELQQQIDTITRHVGIVPFHFTMPNFNQLKTKNEKWYSPPWYTHPCGYKFQIVVHVSTRYSDLNRMSVGLYRVQGEFDDQLPWPAKCSITLELINQYQDQDHITKTQAFQLQRVLSGDRLVHHAFIQVAHSDLEVNFRKQTQYVKNDCLQFRVTRVELTK